MNLEIKGPEPEKIYEARIRLADGKTLVGRILGQDDHEVRIINASEEVATYSKARTFTKRLHCEGEPN
jgi:hypothetical protein